MKFRASVVLSLESEFYDPLDLENLTSSLVVKESLLAVIADKSAPSSFLQKLKLIIDLTITMFGGVADDTLLR